MTRRALKERPRQARILLVEDSPAMAAVYQSYLEAEQHTVQVAGNGAEALAALDEALPDLVLLDLHLPDMPGMTILQHIHDHNLGCAVVIITAHGSLDIASEAMRLGAADFVSKPFDAARLNLTVANALENRLLSKVVNQYRRTFTRDRFHGFIGSSLAMQAVFRIIESAAPSKATVFITGESGTGKELCAEAIHQESPRRKGPLVALNCAAIPADLMESEIFGHVKGAFTGAVSQREGAASRADGGTLFLDEVCEMDLDLQSKLLRFIQSRRYTRVGDNKELQADIRIVCATNRDPLEEVRAGRFREDLYYRLNVIPLPLPPLRERGDDILQIAEHLLADMVQEEGKGFRGFSEAAADALLSHHWPGNVRELENVLRNMVVLNDGTLLEYSMLPAHLQAPAPAAAAPAAAAPEQAAPERTPAAAPAEPAPAPASLANDEAAAQIRPLWLQEKEIIERSIRLCDGNIPRAAALLEISASTIYRKRMGWEKMQEADALSCTDETS
ncbi:sigma-54-dependent transcriptional regulator [Oceanimonas marisflavi]|uniref:sigma-54-dependent transcriptional regulator n=1 Tax=Oceanimonas marisflavi TaxID=2059724 RepID=UPI000D31D323|nr:sigma-54 dependent transcriptional regulator [Oceanimonas marisflavi]